MPQQSNINDMIGAQHSAPDNHQSQQQQQESQNQYDYPQSQYPKHQPLIDQVNMVAPNNVEYPNVEFNSSKVDDSSNQDYSAYSPTSSATRTINMRYQLFLDKISPHWKARWIFSLFALAIFMARVVISQGWYVICYALSIYYLNLLIGFISPKVDPGMSLNDDDDLGDPMLPTRANDEFRPFIRRLPEFKFWISGTKATLISLFLSLFDVFDVPVFWPILLIYFIILFACTMREQIKHMIRYSYVPWDSGKKKYAGHNSSSNPYPQTV